MKTLIFLFGYIAFACVDGGRIQIQSPKLKVEITHQVNCSRQSKYGDHLHINYKVNQVKFVLRQIKHCVAFSGFSS